MRLLPVGDRAILVELDSARDRRALAAALTNQPPVGVVEMVPAPVTVLVRTVPGTSLQRLADQIRDLRLDRPEAAPPTDQGDPLTIPVI